MMQRSAARRVRRGLVLMSAVKIIAASRFERIFRVALVPVLILCFVLALAL